MPKSNKARIEVLKTRICNGYIWMNANQDHPEYPDALKLYESLVDEAKTLGINEKDCWPATEQDIEDIFVPKQLTYGV